MKGRLATFIFKLFNTEPMSALFDTGAMCSCTSVSLYDQISKKVAMIKRHLKVGQEDGTSLGPKGLLRPLIEINNNYFEHLFIVCQNLKQLYYMEWILTNVIKLELIGTIQQHHTYGIREEN